MIVAGFVTMRGIAGTAAMLGALTVEAV